VENLNLKLETLKAESEQPVFSMWCSIFRKAAPGAVLSEPERETVFGYVRVQDSPHGLYNSRAAL
jgi:hypothetical protein